MKMNRILYQYFEFLIEKPHFCSILGTFLIQPVPMIPWLLNWIIYWIESPQFFLNWIIVWIEFWETNIESIIELNPFLPKFKLWIESFWVSIMATSHWPPGPLIDLPWPPTNLPFTSHDLLWFFIFGPFFTLEFHS